MLDSEVQRFVMVKSVSKLTGNCAISFLLPKNSVFTFFKNGMILRALNAAFYTHDCPP